MVLGVISHWHNAVIPWLHPWLYSLLKDTCKNVIDVILIDVIFIFHNVCTLSFYVQVSCCIFITRTADWQISVWSGLLPKMADSTLSKLSCIFPKCRVTCANRAILSEFRRSLASVHMMALKLPVCIFKHVTASLCKYRLYTCISIFNRCTFIFFLIHLVKSTWCSESTCSRAGKLCTVCTRCLQQWIVN